MKTFIAYNRITGLWWDGNGFNGARNTSHYVRVTAVELAVLRYTYLNVAVLPHGGVL